MTCDVAAREEQRVLGQVNGGRVGQTGESNVCSVSDVRKPKGQSVRVRGCEKGVLIKVRCLKERMVASWKGLRELQEKIILSD